MVLVDMEMPKSCRFCHLQDVCVPFQREVVTEAVSIDTLNERHRDCPIKGEILDNATNGDVIRKLFSPLSIKLFEDGSVHGETNDDLFVFTTVKSWWNAPYKSESEE